MNQLPAHYRATIGALVKFAVIGIALGLLLGIVWTEMRRSVRYTTGAATQVERQPGSRVRLELPPGMMFETGLDLKLGHGHVILVAGLLPLGFALMLLLAHACGGREIGAGTLRWAIALYLPGAAVALVLMLYKGWAQFLAVRAGEFDLARVDAALFLGSRALRGACYGISHTVMAAGAFVLLVAVWRSFGGRTAEPPQPAA